MTQLASAPAQANPPATLITPGTAPVSALQSPPAPETVLDVLVPFAIPEEVAVIPLTADLTPLRPEAAPLASVAPAIGAPLPTRPAVQPTTEATQALPGPTTSAQSVRPQTPAPSATPVPAAPTARAQTPPVLLSPPDLVPLIDQQTTGGEDGNLVSDLTAVLPLPAETLTPLTETPGLLALLQATAAPVQTQLAAVATSAALSVQTAAAQLLFTPTPVPAQMPVVTSATATSNAAATASATTPPKTATPSTTQIVSAVTSDAAQAVNSASTTIQQSAPGAAAAASINPGTTIQNQPSVPPPAPQLPTQVAPAVNQVAPRAQDAAGATTSTLPGVLR